MQRIYKGHNVSVSLHYSYSVGSDLHMRTHSTAESVTPLFRLFDRLIYNTLLSSLCLNQPLPQLDHIPNRRLVSWYTSCITAQMR